MPRGLLTATSVQQHARRLFNLFIPTEHKRRTRGQQGTQAQAGHGARATASDSNRLVCALSHIVTQVQFVFTFVSSIIIGVVCALFAALTFKHLHLRDLSTTPLEISLMLVFSYMPYLLAASMRLSGPSCPPFPLSFLPALSSLLFPSFSLPFSPSLSLSLSLSLHPPPPLPHPPRLATRAVMGLLSLQAELHSKHRVGCWRLQRKGVFKPLKLHHHHHHHHGYNTHPKRSTLHPKR